jgi:hypothetical protein
MDFMEPDVCPPVQLRGGFQVVVIPTTLEIVPQSMIHNPLIHRVDFEPGSRVRRFETDTFCRKVIWVCIPASVESIREGCTASHPGSRLEIHPYFCVCFSPQGEDSAPSICRIGRIGRTKRFYAVNIPKRHFGFLGISQTGFVVAVIVILIICLVLLITCQNLRSIFGGRWSVEYGCKLGPSARRAVVGRFSID